MHLVLPVVLVLVAMLSADGYAATQAVNTTADTFDAVCDLADCSLKDAFYEAENNFPPDVIELQPGATYVVSTPYVTYLTGANAFPKVTTTITVNGHGATIRRGASAPSMRFLEIDPTGLVTLSNLTLQDGGFTNNMYGAAIRSVGSLTIDNCVFRNNKSTGVGGLGGAVFNQDGIVQVTRSSFIGNRATRGGAIHTQNTQTSPGNFYVDQCTFDGNKALLSTNANGGAINLTGHVTALIANSTFVNNVSDLFGGAIAFNGIPNNYVIDLVNLTIVGNTAAQGGGLYPSTCVDPNSCPVANKPRLTNTIVANNFTTQLNPNCANILTSVGHNIIGHLPNSTNCQLTPPTNPPDYTVTTLAGISLQRDTGDPGGLHRRPLPTSLPVNNGDAGFCSALDQLSLDRQGASCEIGAVEVRACVPPPDRLVGWWPFDEVSGATALDIYGATANNGTYINAPTSTTAAMVSRAHCFDGTSQRMVVNDHPEIDFAGDCASGIADSFTIDTWVKTPALGVRPIVDKRESAVNFLRGYKLFIQDGQLGFQMATGPGNNVCGTPGSACTEYLAPPVGQGGVDLADNRWHHVAVAVSRCQSPAGEMYIDGALTHTFTPLLGELSNAAALRVGDAAPVPVANPLFQGCLDELELFKRALTAGEVASLYDAGWAGKCKPSVIVATDCVSGFNKNLTQVARMQGKSVYACFKDAAASKLEGMTAADCLTADRDGKVARATAKTSQVEATKCDGVVTEVGPEGADAVNAAAVTEVVGVASDVFGGDLDAALALPSADPVAAKCQGAAVKGYHKIVDAKLKVFVACAKKLLHAGTADATTLAACVDDVAEPGSIAASAQPGGKIGGAVAKLSAKLSKDCDGVDVATRFPNACSATSPATLGACIDVRVECRVCRMLDRASSLDVDCDAFDDGVANGSCGW